MAKKAIITGITGQDGSYLAELLLEKGYEVHGIVRRSSTETFERIAHLTERVTLHQADLLDQLSIIDVLRTVTPDEVYNLAAMSFVPTSWKQPVLTGEFTGIGVTRVLEAIRLLDPKRIRFYQASSSEMFGKVQEVPQRETTPFYPRSPYGVAKVYGHWITVNYRESYNMYACSGILFNHECLAPDTPLLVKRNGQVDTVTVEELVPLRTKGRNVQTFEVPDLSVWDGTQWTAVRCITATHRRRDDPDHEMHWIETRAGVVRVTAHHRMLDSTHESLPARAVKEGASLALAETLPPAPGWTAITPEMAEFLGLMTAEGYVPDKPGTLQFTNNDSALRQRVADLWSRLFLGTTHSYKGVSGFNPEQAVEQLNLNGGGPLCNWLRSQLYNKAGFKRIPPLVLNATTEVQKAYLAGYYAGDGLKAGNGESVKTNSSVLALGLSWLYANQGQPSTVYVEHRGDRDYYQLNLGSSEVQGMKGQHLRKPPAEVRRIRLGGAADWVFDLETASGVLMAGVGRVLVHNSERRGKEFVTRKVTDGVARIKLGQATELRLGNLDARRDWGFAGDYVEAMWLMLQQDQPDDYVVATGETHSVQELVEAAFNCVGLDWKKYVVLDPAFIRPAEVDLLIGDPTKAAQKLGWRPKVTFQGLVQRMVQADLLRVQGKPSGNCRAA